MNLLQSGKLKHHNVPLNHLIAFTVPAEYHNFSKTVITSIAEDLIKLWEGKHGVFNIPNLQVLKEISWRWVTSEGNFTTRLAKQIKAAWDLNIPSNILEQIGNTAKTDYVPAKEVYFDITNNFDWKSGDFGDGGSCFWQGRKDIREAMKKEGNFYALRIFQPMQREDFLGPRDGWFGMRTRANSKIFYPGYEGVGRSWLYETNIQLRLQGKLTPFPVIILFNSYGANISAQSLVLAAYLNKERGHCALTNKGKQHGGLYVNGPGYIIGTSVVTRSVNKFDFGLQNPYDLVMAGNPAPEPTIIGEFENAPGGGIRRKKLRTEKERLQRRKSENERSRIRVSDYDYTRGLFHQRYIQTVSAQRNKSWLREVHGNIKYYIGINHPLATATPHLSEVSKKLDSLTPIYKKLEYDPIKIIHHHIKHHLL